MLQIYLLCVMFSEVVESEVSMKSNAFRRSAKEKDEEHASLAKKMVKLREDLQM